MDKAVLHGIEIALRPNRRARNLRLSINKEGQPVLTIPFLCSQRRALKWAELQLGWIQKNSFTPSRFVLGGQFSLLGQEVQLQKSPKKMTYLTDSVLYIAGEPEFIHRRTKDFIKKALLPVLQKKVKEKATRLGTPYKRISIKETSSRWGSCSSQGNLSFCWRIALAPTEVLDYLVAHEVAHLKHMNHSPRFWKTVSELTPHTLMAKRWLKTNGHKLPK